MRFAILVNMRVGAVKRQTNKMEGVFIGSLGEMTAFATVKKKDHGSVDIHDSATEMITTVTAARKTALEAEEDRARIPGGVMRTTAGRMGDVDTEGDVQQASRDSTDVDKTDLYFP